MIGGDFIIRCFDIFTGRSVWQFDTTGIQLDQLLPKSQVADLTKAGIFSAKRESLNQDALKSNQPQSICFDESDQFLQFTNKFGIATLQASTQQVIGILGLREAADRFMAVSLFQGAPMKSKEGTVGFGGT